MKRIPCISATYVNMVSNLSTVLVKDYMVCENAKMRKCEHPPEANAMTSLFDHC